MAFPSWPPNRRLAAAALLGLVLGLAGCGTVPVAPPSTGAVPAGDEIIVAGKRFSTGTRVITWQDPGGYNAYTIQPAVHGRRSPAGGAAATRAPTLTQLRRRVDQFVLHYDGAGLSRRCFEVLQQRRLSVHFLLDIDGTIYQTLDLQERAWHAGESNDRSVGVEIANLGAYPPPLHAVLQRWYHLTPQGQVRLVPPATAGNPRLHTPGFVGRPQRPEPVTGKIHGRDLIQYDLTPEQYAALIKLTAALHRVFPAIKLDYPRDRQGRLVTGKLPAAQLAGYQGVIGHFHLQENKVDPGPAFQWDPVINGAKRELARK